jgi:integrase
MDQGFLAFVAMSPDGPLFYKTPKVPVANNEFNPRRAPATTTRDMLGAWVRKLGLTDSELSPNHSWRHTFKQIAERSEISEKYHDAITGHAPASIGRSYGTPTDEDLAKALTKFPRYIL